MTLQTTTMPAVIGDRESLYAMSWIVFVRPVLYAQQVPLQPITLSITELRGMRRQILGLAALLLRSEAQLLLAE